MFCRLGTANIFPYSYKESLFEIWFPCFINHKSETSFASSTASTCLLASIHPQFKSRATFLHLLGQPISLLISITCRHKPSPPPLPILVGQIIAKSTTFASSTRIVPIKQNRWLIHSGRRGISPFGFLDFSTWFNNYYYCSSDELRVDKSCAGSLLIIYPAITQMSSVYVS